MPTQQESNSSILNEIYKYNPSAIIELFELDLTPLQEYYTSKGVPIATTNYYFHNGYNERYGTINQEVKWGNPEITYTARPIQIEGLLVSSAGETPRPTLTVANHDLFFTQACKAYANLVGAKIRRVRTFVKFLNASNFTAGNPSADPQAKFPDDVYNIDRMSESIPGQVTFELSSAWDVEGIMLPRRQIVANICPWTYKSDPCTWSVSGAVTVGSLSGTATGTATTYTQVATTKITGSGSGAKLTVVKSGAGTYTSATVSNPGTGYTVGNTIKVLGTALGGATPANDLTVTITEVTGSKFFDADDLIVSTASEDVCGKRLTSCKIRFGTRALPFGGFPSAGLYGKPI